MDEQKKSSRFGLGLIFGTIIGAVSAFFLSPKSGEENREMAAKKLHELEKMIEEAKIPEKVSEIYGEVTEEGTKLYKKISKEVAKRLHELEVRMEDVDAEKYKKLIEVVVSDAVKEHKLNAEKLAKLKTSFVKDWSKVMGEKSKN